MVRKAAVVLSTLLMLAATQALAVGLGGIQLESALNQPLQAQIEIRDLGNIDPQLITVSLASESDFRRFSIDRIDFLLDIEFEIETSSVGTFVHLSTRQPVREPFLSIILDTRWPNGRILSEHTVLLDLPVFNDGAASPGITQPLGGIPEPAQGVVQREPPTEANPVPVLPDASVTQPLDSEATPDTAVEAEDTGISTDEDISETFTNLDSPATPEPVATIETTDPTTTSAGSDLSGETVEVEEADTLWGVALRVRPSGDVSVHQTMLAIQRLNPQAFPSNNINLLRAGEVLRIPDLTAIQSINQQQAVSEVVRQNQQANLTAEPLSAPASGPSTTDPGQLGQLSVVTAEESDLTNAGANDEIVDENARLDARIQALEDRLAVRAEDADRAAFQQEELITRLNELDAQIASALEIITLQDLQLARLQESLTEASLASESTAEIAAPIVDEQSEQLGQAGLMDQIIQSIANSSLTLLIAVVVVVLLLVTLLIRRSKLAPAGFDVEMNALADVDEVEVENEHFVAHEDTKDSSKFTPLTDLTEDDFDVKAEPEQIETIIVEAHESGNDQPEVVAFDDPDDDLAVVDEESFAYSEGQENHTDTNDDIFQVEESEFDSAVDDDELLEADELADDDGLTSLDPFIPENESAGTEDPLENRETTNLADTSDDSTPENPVEDEGFFASKGGSGEVDESEDLTRIDDGGSANGDSQAVAEPASETINEEIDGKDFDFDLDNFLDEPEQLATADVASEGERVDFNLEDFEEENDQKSLDTEAQITDEIAGFDHEDIDNNVEVMFDLADKQVDTTPDSEEPFDEFVEFVAESPAESIEVGGIEEETQVETVNFDITQVSDPEDTDPLTEVDSSTDELERVDFASHPGDEADSKEDELDEMPLVFSANENIDLEETLDEKTEIFDFELEELDENETTELEQGTGSLADSFDELVIDSTEGDTSPEVTDIDITSVQKSGAESAKVDEGETGGIFQEINSQPLNDVDTQIDEPELADLSLSEIDNSVSDTDDVEFDILSQTDTASIPEDDTLIEGARQAADIEGDALADTATEAASESPVGDEDKLADSTMTAHEIDEPEDELVELSEDDEDSDYDDIHYKEPQTRTSVLTDIDDLEFLSADAEQLLEGSEDEFDFLSDDDESATKLDLAYAYQKMGDFDGAREILEEVLKEGNEAQSSEARNLLEALHE